MHNSIKYTMNLEEQVHKDIKVFASIKGMSIKDYILSLIKEDMNNEKDIFAGYSHTPNEKTIKSMNDPHREKLDNVGEIWKD